jgi:hypothetical protein
MGQVFLAEATNFGRAHAMFHQVEGILSEGV